jgi:hypothetical protein
MDTSKRLQKTAITKMLKRVQLEDFCTHQFGNDVVITFKRSDLAFVECVLDIQGFGYDVCVARTSEAAIYRNPYDFRGVAHANAGRRVVRVSLGVDDKTNAYMMLIVSFAQHTTEVSA